ncbi:MAG: hypothetical protein RBR77_07045 [Thauera sp.]|jgi:hypothetical protein|nr:hypothetical protein [Thauera sp.]
MAADFLAQYLQRQRESMPPWLSCGQLALMMADASGKELGDIDRHRRSCGAVLVFLRQAAFSGLLKARLRLGAADVDKTHQDDDLFVHYDDARRYFAGLDLVPPEDSDLARWLRGPIASSGKKSLVAQDKSDFQGQCLEQWERNPAQVITGPAGVAQAVGVGYLRMGYAQRTLDGWARAVAPEGVSGRRGRPAAG